MNIVQFILTTTVAIGSANAASSRLAEAMSIDTGYELQLHSNVTAYDVCMYLGRGYQYNQIGYDTLISTYAYDDYHQGVAKILTRYVNDVYDNTTEAFDTYNRTQYLAGHDSQLRCDGITDKELDSWFWDVGTDYDQNLQSEQA